MADEDDTTSWGNSCLDDAYNVGNGKTVEQRPHGKVLESSRRGWELIAQCVILHINSDQIVKARSWETQDTGDFLGVEQIGSFIPMNPHATKVISKKIIKGIAR